MTRRGHRLNASAEELAKARSQGSALASSTSPAHLGHPVARCYSDELNHTVASGTSEAEVLCVENIFQDTDDEVMRHAEAEEEANRPRRIRSNGLILLEGDRVPAKLGKEHLNGKHEAVERRSVSNALHLG
jgi:hypothetical protein